MTTENEVQDALARLCNAVCMLDLAIDAHQEIVVDSDEWKVNEALRGVARLLDGCYTTLGEAINKAKRGT